MFTYSDGEIPLPIGPGLGVTLDRDKLAEYSELYEKLGGYPYDRDPERPGWYSTAPNRRYAEPKGKARRGIGRGLGTSA